MDTLPLSLLDEYFEIIDSKLYWRKANSDHFNAKIKAGDLAGHPWTTKRHYTEYLIVYFMGAHYRVHRIMYQMYHSLETLSNELVIDHIDRNGLNNSKENLRLVTQQVNTLNAKLQKNNTSGVAGVQWYARNNKWGVRIPIGRGRRKFIGLFESFEEACNAREHEMNNLRTTLEIV